MTLLMTAIFDFHKVMRALTTPFTIPTPSENQLIIIANHKSVGVARHNLFWRSWVGGGGGEFAHFFVRRKNLILMILLLNVVQLAS